MICAAFGAQFSIGYCVLLLLVLHYSLVYQLRELTLDLLFNNGNVQRWLSGYICEVDVMAWVLGCILPTLHPRQLLENIKSCIAHKVHQYTA